MGMSRSASSWGLSPHTRGKRTVTNYTATFAGPIPAYAGETSCHVPIKLFFWAYPRIRGGNQPLAEVLQSQKGLSPHTRGKRSIQRAAVDAIGPIPAYAGETSSRHRCGSGRRAYPRIRGGNAKGIPRPMLPVGLSPHTRGKRQMPTLSVKCRGPIPAYAGETQHCLQCFALNGAYPRIRGGNWHSFRVRGVTRGLSPHTRGKPKTGTSR